ncbi:MAG: YihY family inner membrane protein [Acidobacteria bacterium]|nr:YihY family inner membrane protein [Acidobacteriota bacterium]
MTGQTDEKEPRRLTDRLRAARTSFWNYWTLEAREIYSKNAIGKKRGRAALVETLLFAREVIREFWSNEGSLRAASLAYTTLLSLVPLIVAFSIVIESYFARILPDMRSQLDSLLNVILPYQAPQIASHLTRFADQASTASAFGAIVFLVISFRLFMAVEVGFNQIWHIKKTRSYRQRLRAFTMLLFWGPILIGISLTTSASLAGSEYLDVVIRRTPLPSILPMLVLFIAFTMLFWLVPATKVSLRSAFFGAVMTTVLFELVRFGFGVYAESLFAGRLNVIYGALGLIILFLLAIEILWVVILLGVVVSYVHQNLQGIVRASEMSLEERPEYELYFAIRALIEIARRFDQREEPPSSYRLAEMFRATDQQMADILIKLERAHLAKEIGGEWRGWLPACDPDRIRIEEVVDAIEGGARLIPRYDENDRPQRAISDLFHFLDTCRSDGLQDNSIGRLVRELYGPKRQDDASGSLGPVSAGGA